MAHTPTPWKLDSSSGDYHVRDADGDSLMCDMQYYPWAPGPDDMAFIVRAVNSFEAMRDALNEIAAWDDKRANERLKETGSYGAFDEPGAVQTARAALALVDKDEQ